MNILKSAAFALTLPFCTLGASAEDIKGKVTVPPAAETKSSSETQKPTGVVVWVENAKDTQPPADKLKVSQKDAKFDPTLVVAVAGQTVEFPNEDNIAHNVFSMASQKKFNLGIYPKGESKEVVFEKPGIIDVFCSLHRNMHTVVLVVPSKFFAMAAADGTYEIKGLPAGDYKVTAWTYGSTPVTQDVKVAEKAGGSSDFALKPEAAKAASADKKEAGKDDKQASAETK